MSEKENQVLNENILELTDDEGNKVQFEHLLTFEYGENFYVSLLPVTPLEDFEDGDIYEVCCPTCGDIVCIDSDMLEEGQTTCPNCGELLEFDLEDDGEETEDSDNDDK